MSVVSRTRYALLTFFILCVLSTHASSLSKENTQQITARSGSIITITLKSNPTTGYSWKVSKLSDGKIVKAVSSRYEADRPALSGSGGKELWSFKALKPGNTRIEMAYQRPWEKGTPPVEAKTFNIRVK